MCASTLSQYLLCTLKQYVQLNFSNAFIKRLPHQIKHKDLGLLRNFVVDLYLYDLFLGNELLSVLPEKDLDRIYIEET